MQNAVFAAFFVVDNKLYGNRRFVRPLCVRGLMSVSQQVSWIVMRHGFLSKF